MSSAPSHPLRHAASMAVRARVVPEGADSRQNDIGLASSRGVNPCGCGMHSTGSDTASLLNDLLDTANVLVVELDCQGRVIWFNQAVAKLSGRSLADMEGLDWVENMVPAAERETWRQSCAASADRQLPTNHKSNLLTKEGRLRSIDWFHKPTHGEDGSWVGLICLGHDVSDAENVRAELYASEERAQGVLDTAVNAIITISERGIVETVNAATERIFGYGREEMIGNNISMLMPTPYRERHDGYLDTYKRTGDRKIIGIGREVVALRKDGTVFPIDLSVGEVKLPGGRIFTGIIRDLSERKELEEKILSISEEEQSRIGQDIHDDLCQQLAAIGCLAKVVYQRLSASGIPEALQLNEIVRLITSANVRAREMSRGLMPVVLDSDGLMAALADLARSTERIFRVSCPFHCDPPVQVDDNKMATQLYRIAQEAVGNAIKHSQAERIEISLDLNDGMIILAIRDNGKGISQAEAGKSGGMGLLTMSHRARMVGGTLSVELDRFGGTVVECIAPALPQANQP